MKKKFLIIADGDPLPEASLARLRRGRFCVALDGAAEAAKKNRWVPNLILGDFDSASPKTLAYFGRKGVPLMHTPDQNFTDLEKALGWAIAQGATSIWVAQGLGNRLDHSLGNLSSLSCFHHPKRELAFFSATERVEFLSNATLLRRGKKGRGFALIPFPAAKIHSEGLVFELTGQQLELGAALSVSNRAKTAQVKIKAAGSCLVIEEMLPGKVWP